MLQLNGASRSTILQAEKAFIWVGFSIVSTHRFKILWTNFVASFECECGQATFQWHYEHVPAAILLSHVTFGTIWTWEKNFNYLFFVYSQNKNGSKLQNLLSEPHTKLGGSVSQAALQWAVVAQLVRDTGTTRVPHVRCFISQSERYTFPSEEHIGPVSSSSSLHFSASHWKLLDLSLVQVPTWARVMPRLDGWEREDVLRVRILSWKWDCGFMMWWALTNRWPGPNHIPFCTFSNRFRTNNRFSMV